MVIATSLKFAAAASALGLLAASGCGRGNVLQVGNLEVPRQVRVEKAEGDSRTIDIEVRNVSAGPVRIE